MSSFDITLLSASLVIHIYLKSQFTHALSDFGRNCLGWNNKVLFHTPRTHTDCACVDQLRRWRPRCGWGDWIRMTCPRLTLMRGYALMSHDVWHSSGNLLASSSVLLGLRSPPHTHAQTQTKTQTQIQTQTLPISDSIISYHCTKHNTRPSLNLVFLFSCVKLIQRNPQTKPNKQKTDHTDINPSTFTEQSIPTNLNIRQHPVNAANSLRLKRIFNFNE